MGRKKTSEFSLVIVVGAFSQNVGTINEQTQVTCDFQKIEVIPGHWMKSIIMNWLFYFLSIFSSLTALPDFLIGTTVALGECRPELGSNQTVFKVNRKKTDGWDYPCGFESYEMKRFI